MFNNNSVFFQSKLVQQHTKHSRTHMQTFVIRYVSITKISIKYLGDDRVEWLKMYVKLCMALHHWTQ